MSDKFVTGGVNTFKCRHCSKEDPKGWAKVVITLQNLARIRVYGRGAVNVKCNHGHDVSFILKASNTYNMMVAPVMLEIQT